MAKLKEAGNEKKELGVGKIILIVAVVFTFIPITIMSMLYFFNKDFQFTANDYLSTLPGSAGQYFDKFPTREERETQKREVAKYLVDIDVSSATDKLLIIQKTDSALYSDLIGLMSKEDSRQAEKVLERTRESLMKQDILVSTISQIENDELSLLREKAQYYEKQDLMNAVLDIDASLKAEKNSYKSIAAIISHMKEENAAEILNELDLDMSKKIISNIELESKKIKLEELLNTMENRENQLANLAQIYNVEKSEKILLEDLGSNKKYSVDELSVIYRNMDKIKVAKVLSQIEDKKFVYSLIEQIKKDEIFDKGVDSLTPELIEGTSIFEEYNKKVSEFTNIASKMEKDKILEMINKLYNSSKSAQKYDINNEDSIIITDQDLAIRILSELQPRIGAEVLSKMEPSMASEISKKISLP